MSAEDRRVTANEEAQAYLISAERRLEIVKAAAERATDFDGEADAELVLAIRDVQSARAELRTTRREMATERAAIQFARAK